MFKWLARLWRRMFGHGAEVDRTRGSRPHLSIGSVIRVCPGRRHAWFDSNIGPVRKPWAQAEV